MDEFMNDIAGKMCIFGGTFSPIHNGHVELAKKAADIYSFEKIIFLPTGGSYMKKDVLASSHRLAMTELVCAEEDLFICDSYEALKEGPSYTSETLEYFKRKYEDKELYFLIGEDSLRYIHKWKNPDIIFALANIIVAKRKNVSAFYEDDVRTIDECVAFVKKEYNARISYFDFSNDISSSFIRTCINQGDIEAVNNCLNKKVLDYILENNIYK